MSVIIRYAKTVYDNKISTLEGYISQLDGHLETLKGYRDELDKYWNDSEGRRYRELVSKEIKAVINARSRANSLRNIYDEASKALKAQQSIAGGILDEAEIVINSLGIGDK